MNTFNEYQSQTALTAIYPGHGTPLGLIYCALKLAGESGEVAENVGKAIRDDALMGGDDSFPGCFVSLPLEPARRDKLIKELGDVLWYVSQLCTELGITMDDVAAGNIAKLADRKARGVLQGSGDDR